MPQLLTKRAVDRLRKEPGKKFHARPEWGGGAFTRGWGVDGVCGAQMIREVPPALIDWVVGNGGGDSGGRGMVEVKGPRRGGRGFGTPDLHD